MFQDLRNRVYCCPMVVLAITLLLELLRFSTRNFRCSPLSRECMIHPRVVVTKRGRLLELRRKRHFVFNDDPSAWWSVVHGELKVLEELQTFARPSKMLTPFTRIPHGAHKVRNGLVRNTFLWSSGLGHVGVMFATFLGVLLNLVDGPRRVATAVFAAHLKEIAPVGVDFLRNLQILWLWLLQR